MPLANDHIMSRRSIKSYRHLEYQNLCIIPDCVDVEISLVPILETRKAVALLAIYPIMSARSIQS